MFGGFGWIRLVLFEYIYKNVLGNTRRESVKNTPKHLRIIYESGTNKGINGYRDQTSSSNSLFLFISQLVSVCYLYQGTLINNNGE